MENFSLHQLAAAQRDHYVWKGVIYALESGDETPLPLLPVPFSQFSLSSDRVLCRYWPSKRHPVEQYVIPEPLTPTVLHLAHDAVVAGHPGRERTLAALRTHYYWPTMKIDTEKYVDQCTKCAVYKGVATGPAPIQQYHPPTRPFECVSVDLLQLPPSHQGSKYVVVMVDMFSRFVILEPIAKTARAVAHAIVSRLICEHTAPRVLLSDNGAEFRNKILQEICSQFNVTQTFTVAYHPVSNGLVERANRKILEALHPIVGRFNGTWENWLPQVEATINAKVCESTGQTPHFIVFGKQKGLPYDLLSSQQPPAYDPEAYAQIQLATFATIHKEVAERLKHPSEVRTAKQHRSARPVSFLEGDVVMLAAPDRQSKLSPKFSGPYKITHVMGGNKYRIFNSDKACHEVIHSDRSKPTAVAPMQGSSSPDVSPASVLSDFTAVSLPSSPDFASPSHGYNLRPRG